MVCLKIHMCLPPSWGYASQLGFCLQVGDLPGSWGPWPSLARPMAQRARAFCGWARARAQWAMAVSYDLGLWSGLWSGLWPCLWSSLWSVLWPSLGQAKSEFCKVLISCPVTFGGCPEFVGRSVSKHEYESGRRGLLIYHLNPIWAKYDSETTCIFVTH